MFSIALGHLSSPKLYSNNDKVIKFSRLFTDRLPLLSLFFSHPHFDPWCRVNNCIFTVSFHRRDGGYSTKFAQSCYTPWSLLHTILCWLQYTLYTYTTIHFILHMQLPCSPTLLPHRFTFIHILYGNSLKLECAMFCNHAPDISSVEFQRILRFIK